MTYTKTITPAFETIGRRQRMTGHLAELHDGNLLIHSQQYSTAGGAEQALDRIVYDLLSDLHEHGLVDDVPAALEAEGVTSTQIPSWLLDAQAKVGACSQAHPCDNVNHNHTGYRTPVAFCATCGNDGDCPDCDAFTTNIIATMAHAGLSFSPPSDPAPDDGPGDPGYEYPRCHNCARSHHTWQCPAIYALLFAEPVVMVLDVEYAPFSFAP